MATFFYSTGALTDEHYRAIGLIAAEWSVLEIALETAIIQYISDEWDDGRVLTVELGNVARVNAIIALAKLNMERADKESFNYITPDQFATLVKICNKIDNLRTRRNEAVHAYWLPPDFRGTGTTQHMRVSAKRVLKAELRPMALSDLNSLAEEIAFTHDEFRKFFADELSAWHFL